MIAYAFLQSRRLAQASGEKESAKDRRSCHCPRSTTQSSRSSPAHRPIDARTAGEPSADHSNKSAKVVVGSGLVDYSQKMTAAAMQIAEK
jgi:hypothetical protein